MAFPMNAADTTPIQKEKTPAPHRGAMRAAGMRAKSR